MKTLLALSLFALLTFTARGGDVVDTKSLSPNDYIENLVATWNAADFPSHKKHFTAENASSYDPVKFAKLRAEYGTWNKSLYLGCIEEEQDTLHLWKVWFENRKYPELFKLYISKEGRISGLWLQK
jgi:hypothetical protein